MQFGRGEPLPEFEGDEKICGEMRIDVANTVVPICQCPCKICIRCEFVNECERNLEVWKVKTDEENKKVLRERITSSRCLIS
jgi:hypothetical protein